MESPSFQAAHQLVQRVQLVGIGAEERVKFYLIPVFDCQRNVAHLGQTAADNDAEFLLEIFLAIAPAATRIAVSRAEERPPPR